MCTVDGIAIKGRHSCSYNDSVLTDYPVFDAFFNDTDMRNTVGVVMLFMVDVVMPLQCHAVFLFEHTQAKNNFDF